jgi:uncharacterized protein (TIGR02452 family)
MLKISLREYADTRIALRRESTVDTVFMLQSTGIDGGRAGVLNFASAHKPGGGFINGAMAQEEALAYCSDLYMQQEGSPYYDINAKTGSKMYTDTAIYSRVTFFRDSAFRLVRRPYAVNVITCPAVNLAQVRAKGENVKTAGLTMMNRMRKILYLFAEKGCREIVLGAYGCGVFGNDPRDVANMWRRLLVDENLRRSFGHIIFAVYDKNDKERNFDIFNNILSALPNVR